MFPAVNTLYNALLNDPSFQERSFPTARRQRRRYGRVQRRWPTAGWLPLVARLSGLRPLRDVTVRHLQPDGHRCLPGTIGLPLPSTEIAIRDDDNNDVKQGEPGGKICICGPQVMAGYWQRRTKPPRCSRRTASSKPGDIGVMDERGYVKIVDRKKDMVLVSGWRLPGTKWKTWSPAAPACWCAVIGVPDEKSGEAVRSSSSRKTQTSPSSKCATTAKPTSSIQKPKYIVFPR